MPSSFRSALLAAALLAAPALVSAQGRGAATRQAVESVVITAPSVKARTAPSITSLSIEDFSQGWVFPLASEEFQSSDWYGIVIDGRVAYVPRAAAAPRTRGTRRVAQVIEPGVVTQAGSPAPAPAAAQPETAPAPSVAERQPAPASASAPSAGTRAPAPAVSAPMVAAAPAPAVEQPRPMEQPASHLPAAAESAAAVASPAPAAASPAAKQADQPVFNARRSGLNVTFGLLASATPIETAGIPRAFHVTGNSFIGVRFKALGLYGAPEMGQGAGYKSTMLGGGASLDLINMHFLRVTALGGYTTYEETSIPADSSVVPVTTKLQGPSVGGLASIPFIGPLRLTYRGQYMMATYAGIPMTMTRHYVGLTF